jgi:hypothetical protein
LCMIDFLLILCLMKLSNDFIFLMYLYMFEKYIGLWFMLTYTAWWNYQNLIVNLLAVKKLRCIFLGQTFQYIISFQIFNHFSNKIF